MSKLNLSLLCLWWNSPFFILANIVFYAFIFSLPHPVVGFASLPRGRRFGKNYSLFRKGPSSPPNPFPPLRGPGSWIAVDKWRTQKKGSPTKKRAILHTKMNPFPPSPPPNHNLFKREEGENMSVFMAHFGSLPVAKSPPFLNRGAGTSELRVLSAALPPLFEVKKMKALF